MSKAFTKEDDDRELPPDEEEPEVPAGGKRYITPEGFARLAAERDRLWKVDRRAVVAEVAAAAALGDRSENAEYIYGKKKLREIDRRLRWLDKLLDRLTVVRDVAGDPRQVFFGAFVTVEDEDGKRAEYRIVGPDEIDLPRRWISVDSPLARALIGRKKGAVVEVKRPKGPAEVSIVKVRYERD